jgi:hypothetical protein
VSDEVPDFIRRLREQQGQPVKVDVPGFDDDLVPDLSDSVKPPPDVDPGLQAAVDGVDVLEAYRRWCGKMEPHVGSRRESIMISCPIPGHTDNNPSAAINLDKGDGGVWSCYTCGNIGGDKYTIAAFRFGIPTDSKLRINPSDFPKLRRMMAEDLGYIVKRSIGGQEYVEKPDDDEPEPEQSNVLSFPTALDLSLENQIKDLGIRIEWEEIIPRDTFLWEWMTAVTIDDLPHEYYFWLGLQALAFAAGNDQLMADFQRIKCNMFVCLYGKTGSGKSRALAPFIELLERALPYDEDPTERPFGTAILPSPASAEALLKMFSRELLDPSTNKATDLVQVRGLLRVEEFASFIARASRSTNPMKETLIELYDVLGRDMRHKSISGGTVVAREPFCQMVTTTQPAAIHDFLRRTDAHSGFLNRWVFAAGTRRRDRISYGGIQTDVVKSANMLKLLHFDMHNNPAVHDLSGPALQEWDNFFQKEIVPLHDNSDESMLSRIDLTLKKIILLFTVNERQAAPTADIVRRATSLYNYLRKTYMVFSTDIAFNEQEECRLAVIKIIEKGGQAGASLRDITRGIGGKYPGQVLSQTLKLMIDLDEITERISANAKGPKTKRYTRAG